MHKNDSNKLFGWGLRFHAYQAHQAKIVEAAVVPRQRRPQKVSTENNIKSYLAWNRNVDAAEFLHSIVPVLSVVWHETTDLQKSKSIADLSNLIS